DYLRFYRHLDEERSDSEAAEITGLLGLGRGSRVLDAPCGYGRIANRLAAGGAEVLGLDRDPYFLEVARADAKARGVDVEYVEGDLLEMEFAGEFDAAISWFTSFGYHDDETDRDLLRRYRRALRPGGRLLLETMSAY